MSKETIGKKSSITKQIRGVWGLICSMSSIDQEKNNISLFNLINQVNVQKIDFEGMKQQKKEALLVPVQHEVVTMFRRMGNYELFDNEIKTNIKISLINPKGKALMEFLTKIEFKPHKINCRHRAIFTGFKLTEPGDYEYNIEVLQPDDTQLTNEMVIPFVVKEIENKFSSL
ncbi:MAG: hypothetical protein HYT93_00200 [Parcubacteria group bacterium]|nr:hypothetical protein [Parcubacteria group bacterium]